MGALSKGARERARLRALDIYYARLNLAVERLYDESYGGTTPEVVDQFIAEANAAQQAWVFALEQLDDYLA